MKGKGFINGNHVLQGSIQSVCWVPIRQRSFKRLVTRYQKEIDVTLAATAIGAMLLIGIWGFLTQLAAF